MQPLAADLALFLRVGVRRVEERLAVYRDLPLVGDGQEIEAAQQRRLAAAGRADDGDAPRRFSSEKSMSRKHDGMRVKAFFEISVLPELGMPPPPYALK